MKVTDYGDRQRQAQSLFEVLAQAMHGCFEVNRF
jgi:hypothetical protein